MHQPLVKQVDENTTFSHDLLTMASICQLYINEIPLNVALNNQYTVQSF